MYFLKYVCIILFISVISKGSEPAKGNETLTKPNITVIIPKTPQVILSEGGKLPQQIKIQTEYGHKLEKADKKNTASFSIEKPMDETHVGRENVIEHSNIVTTQHINTTLGNLTKTVNTLSSEQGNTVKVSVKPVNENLSEVVVPKKNDGKQVVGRKGVSYDDVPPSNITSGKLNSTTITAVIKNITTTAKLIPKKPLFTEPDDTPSETYKSDVPIPKIASIETEKKTKKTDYIVPIVAVILSVPLVAIIISVLYKRGTDWWQHRNYRRMDFLIEGMYNN